MEKDVSVNSFFTKISHLKDQLLAIGVSVDDDDLVQTVFDRITFAWEAYLVVVNGHEVQISLKDFGMIVCRKRVKFKPELVLLMKKTLLSLQT